MYRSNVEVVRDVLKAISQVDVPTRIMYKCNLPWNVFMLYIEKLRQSELIIVEDLRPQSRKRKNRIYLSAKGKELLQLLDRTMYMLKSYRLLDVRRRIQ